ncbi:MAG: NAD-dependent deacylase [Anaerolineae bacterium]|jgi:NAD-dependent deacetylase
MSWEREIERAAELIAQARYVVAFTGAGHSTASGIPDFRSPGSGLWERHNPMLVASIWGFRLNPKTFYNWIRPMARTMLEAAPNPGHIALAQMEQKGYIKSVITQNIDNLHQKAGSRHVLELHGHLRAATCIRCYQEFPVNAQLEQDILDGRIPRCDCGGVLKPNVILFGEQLPIRVLNQAMDEARRCDLMLVAGSSLEVTPAADIPVLAVDRGAKAIIINLQPTGFDPHADVVLHTDLTDALPRIAQAL